MEYYVFPTQIAAQACVDYINGSSWFPVIGCNAYTHEHCPEAQKTEKWMETPLEMLSGEFAVLRIPKVRLDAEEVPQELCDQFLVTFGQDIRDLNLDEFVQPNT